MEIIENHDILIVGGGAAGMRAAIAAAETNPKAKIAIISKVYPVRSHSVCAEGGIAAPLTENDSEEQHAFDTIKGSDYLADQDAVEFFVKKSKEEIIQLEKWGCLWSRQPDGEIAVRLFGGMSIPRTIYAADKTGFYIMHSLFEQSLLYENIQRYDEWFVTKLLTGDNGINGLVAIDLKNGKLAAFKAGAVIMATGGAGRIYGHTTNSEINTGDGIALAYEAGAALKDMEMIQFHPTTLPNGNMLISEAARGEGGHLLNKHNERFLKEYLPEKMELGPRDLITRAIISEINKGNAANGPYGPHVELDIRHLGAKKIKERLPTIRETCLHFLNLDPIKHKIPVTPAQHYFMGGIATDTTTQSTVPGLLAAGETACLSIHGANRMGSNSLAECVVFGKQAGETAANLSLKKHNSSLNQDQIETEEKHLNGLLTPHHHTSKSASIQQTKISMQQTMDVHAGITRDQKTLDEGLLKIRTLQEQFSNLSLHDTSLVFNTELTSLLELQYMLTVCEATLISALERKESRGSHSRSDYPNRDDQHQLKHNLIIKSARGPQLRSEAVKITQWQPATRKY